MVDLRTLLRNFNLEKLLSASLLVTGRAHTRSSSVVTFGIPIPASMMNRRAVAALCVHVSKLASLSSLQMQNNTASYAFCQILPDVLWATITEDRKTTCTAHNAFPIWPSPLYISKSFSNSKIYLKQGIVLFYPFSHGYCSKLCSLYENAWGRGHCAIVWIYATAQSKAPGSYSILHEQIKTQAYTS